MFTKGAKQQEAAQMARTRRTERRGECGRECGHQHRAEFSEDIKRKRGGRD